MNEKFLEILYRKGTQSTISRDSNDLGVEFAFVTKQKSGDWNSLN